MTELTPKIASKPVRHLLERTVYQPRQSDEQGRSTTLAAGGALAGTQPGAHRTRKEGAVDVVC